jgi:ferric-dicitrate binding protein FerR (iron transport regulator)
MEQKYTEDTFLAKWLNEELTKEEKIAFEKTPEFKDYQKIIDKMEQFEAPEFASEKVFDKISKHTQKETKVRKLIPNWVSAVAASVAILFGIFFFMDSDTTYETSYGEQLAVVLPDGSKVQLNAKSTLSFDEDDWSEGKRNLSLEGEGYFKVEKGSKFSVETASGTVSVLGTQFNVKKSDKLFEVRCFEGKVSVVNSSDSTILTHGKGYRKVGNQNSVDLNFEDEIPSWISGESVFDATPLKFIFKELEIQYNVTFEFENIDVNQLFSGGFTNENLEVALQTVCLPMQLKFEIIEGTKVIVKRK